MSGSESRIVLCPGQGAQKVGMGRNWCDASPAAAECFAQADAALGFALSELCFDGPQERLDRTDIAQLAIYTTSIASARGLAEKGLLATGVGNGATAPPIGAFAGLSLGEFTALHLAGAFSFEAGLELVRVRGGAMQAAAEASESGMVALTGSDEAAATALCHRVLDALGAGDHVLVPANINGPGQVVISGTRTACEKAAAFAEADGTKATRLQVAGAFHSQVMAPAATALETALETMEFAEPRCPVLSNVTGEAHVPDPQVIRQRLVEQMTNPVRWLQDMQWVVANLEGKLVELAPGRVLTGLMRRIDRSWPVENLAEPPQGVTTS